MQRDLALNCLIKLTVRGEGVSSPARVVDLQAEILPLVGTRDVELLPHRVVAVHVAFVKSKGF
jgi:hypothetical protein